jgi:hypothetical protein
MKVVGTGESRFGRSVMNFSSSFLSLRVHMLHNWSVVSVYPARIVSNVSVNCLRWRRVAVNLTHLHEAESCYDTGCTLNEGSQDI